MRIYNFQEWLENSQALFGHFVFIGLNSTKPEETSIKPQETHFYVMTLLRRNKMQMDAMQLVEWTRFPLLSKWGEHEHPTTSNIY